MTRRVKAGFEKRSHLIALADIKPARLVSRQTLQTKKYLQIERSIREVGVVEPIVVHRLKDGSHSYLILDGHLRYEALQAIGKSETPCLIAKDDEAFTYNKRINRLTSVQEHYMIRQALKAGVDEERLAAALGVNVRRIRERSRLLDGVCPDALQVLKDKEFPPRTATTLKKMKPLRQVEVVQLMAIANNFSSTYAHALLMATPMDQLVKKPRVPRGISNRQRLAMEQEMETLQRDLKAVQDDYGAKMLNLVVANGYLSRLLGNEQATNYLRFYHGDLLNQLVSLQDGIDADFGIDGV